MKNNALVLCALLTFAVHSPPTRAEEGVKVIRDLVYAKVGDRKLLLDLHRPEKANGLLPVIVGIHGGGWASGSKDGGQGSFLAKHGYAVASISYRLSGEAIFPAQIEDCKAAVRWLRAHAKEYHLDPQRIGATGHSAGGHLASLLATSGEVKEFDKGENLDFSSRIQAAAPMSGPTDLLQMDAYAPAGARLKHDAPTSPEARLIGGPIQENKAKAARANPIAYVSGDDPPFLIVHGDQDSTVPYHQAQLLFEALKAARVPVHLHTVKGGGHALGSREANERLVAFFDQHLKGSGASGQPTVETSESQGTDGPPRSGPTTGTPNGRPGFTWEQIRTREGVAADGRVPRDKFKGPPPMFDRLDRNRDGVLSKEDFDTAAPAAPQRLSSPSAPKSSSATPPASPPLGAASSPEPRPANSPRGVSNDAPNAWVGVGAIEKWNTFTVKTGDGVETPAMWAAPEGKGPFPAIVWFHGAPPATGERGLRNEAERARFDLFLKAGFVVCLGDYRSQSPVGSTLTAPDDAAAIIRHVKTLPVVDSKRVAAMGHSLGGATMLLAVTREPVACVVDSAAAGYAVIGMEFGALRGKPPGGALPESDYDKKTALANLGRISAPTLILYGEADPLSRINKTIHDLMKELNKNVRLEIFPGEHHGMLFRPNDKERGLRAWTTMVDFVSGILKTPATSATRSTANERSPRALPGPWAEPKAELDGLQYRTFASKAAGTDVSYAIYLPPDYETAKEKRYPVVYWLHGRGGSQTSAAQLAKRLDPAIRAGKALPVIVVGVNGLKTSSFVDWADGRVPVQTVIVKELIPHVDATYRTIATREGRAIEGFSMGGAGAPKIGFKYPELFGAVSILSGALHDLESYRSRGTAFHDIYGGSAEYFEASSSWKLVEKNAAAIRGRTTVRILVGGKDDLLERNTAFHQQLEKLGLAHDFTVVKDAPHSPGPLLEGVGDATWDFFKRAFASARSTP